MMYAVVEGTPVMCRRLIICNLLFTIVWLLFFPYCWRTEGRQLDQEMRRNLESGIRAKVPSLRSGQAARLFWRDAVRSSDQRLCIVAVDGECICGQK